MADTVEETPVAAEDPRLEHATERLERLTPEPAAAPEPEAQAAPQRPEPAPAVERSPAEHPAQVSWQERTQRRRQQAEQFGYQKALKEIQERLEQIQPAAAPAAVAAQDDDPEPDFDIDTRAWLDWNNRKTQREQQEFLKSQLDPVLQHLNTARETEEQRQQRALVEQQTAAYMQGRQQLMSEAEEIYLQSGPEAEGYGERVLAYIGHPGDPRQGIAPIDGAISLALQRSGVQPQRARQIAQENARGMMELALQEGINPAFFMDTVIRTEMEVLGGYRQQPARAASRPQRPVQQQVNTLRQTAQSAASVAGSLAQGGSGRERVVSAHDVQSNPSPAAIIELAKTKYGGDTRRAVKEVRRLAGQG
jgi:hypothetical protein